ncbi:hypothetical protein RSO01_89920 [Reyranella soli]|uniref:Uncharacterized protein n=1 Tax=Reyranella soli TaxID=1230389 RepID=A0A512NSA2_9HYPH|nr:hypothetical protein RSO01_89920 [Reyranella soli]
MVTLVLAIADFQKSVLVRAVAGDHDILPSGSLALGKVSSWASWHGLLMAIPRALLRPPLPRRYPIVLMDATVGDAGFFLLVDMVDAQPVYAVSAVLRSPFEGAV